MIQPPSLPQGPGRRNVVVTGSRRRNPQARAQDRQLSAMALPPSLSPPAPTLTPLPLMTNANVPAMQGWRRDVFGDSGTGPEAWPRRHRYGKGPGADRQTLTSRRSTTRGVRPISKARLARRFSTRSPIRSASFLGKRQHQFLVAVQLQVRCAATCRAWRLRECRRDGRSNSEDGPVPCAPHPAGG